MTRIDALHELPTPWEPELDARTDALFTRNRDRVWANVLADIRAADSEERAAKLTPHQMQTKLQALFDAADGDCIDVAEDALTAINIRCQEIERIEQRAEQAYFDDVLSRSDSARKI